MAKGKSNIFSFDDLNKELASVNPYGSTMDKSEFSEINGYIHTGNYLLNACVSGDLFKGYPNNRSVSLAGESGVGKTFLALNAVRRAIEDGYNIVYFDSEAAVDRELMEKFGIDTSKVNYQPVNTVQEFRTIATTIIKRMQEAKSKGAELPKVMFVLDSIGNLATQKEIDDAVAGSEKADMTRSKVIKSIFRIIMTPLSDLKIPFIMTNHTYSSQDFFARQVSSGGTGIQYATSIVLMLSKAQLKEKDGEKSGIIVTAKPDKNRFAKPQPIKFHIHFSKGMNPYVGLQDWIDWEEIGVARGKYLGDNKETGEPEYEIKETARSYVRKGLKESVPLDEFFSEKIFTQEVLEKINEKIKPHFNYGVGEVIDTTEDLLED